MSEIQDLAEELVENGMPEVATELRRRGPEGALAEIENEIERLRQYPDSDQLTGNLEVARERVASCPADKLITRSAPQWAWDVIDETLAMDAQSSAFDPKLRDEIDAALAAMTD